MHGRRLSEIVFCAEDLDAVTAFYRDVVGLEPDASAPELEDWSWFRVGPPGTGSRLAIHAGPLPFFDASPWEGERSWGPVHFAIEVPRDRLDEDVERLRSHGVETWGPQEIGWMDAVSFYFVDPVGNWVELWSPHPGSGDR